MKKPLSRYLLASWVGTVVLAAWGMIFWMWVYKPAGVYHTLPNDDQIVQVLQESDVQTGTYFYPWPRDTPATFEQFLDRHKRGPFFKISYVREGVDPQRPSKMVAGLLHHWGVALLATSVLWFMPPSLPLYQRVWIVFAAGSMGTLFIQIGDPIWFHLPWDYSLGVLVYEGISWLLLGVVLGGLLGPARAAAETDRP